VGLLAWSTSRYLAPSGFQDGNGAYAPALLEWDLWPNTTYAAAGQWAYANLRLEQASRGTPLHDPTWRDRALLALHNLTYGQGTQPTPADGRMLTTIRELTQPAFGTETWYEQNFNTVKYLWLCFGLAPELAPDDEDHLLGFDGGELSDIGYAPGEIATMWAASGRAAFKLRAQPAGVRLAGVWQLTPQVELEDGVAGWTWDPATQRCAIEHAEGDVLLALAGATGVDERGSRQGDTGGGNSGGGPSTRLLAPYPVPANPRVNLPFRLGRSGPVRLTLHDSRGRVVAVLVDGPMEAGSGRAFWDGRDARGGPAASGVYTVRLQAGGLVDTQRVVLTR
jgi:hypothetical protein